MAAAGQLARAVVVLLITSSVPCMAQWQLSRASLAGYTYDLSWGDSAERWPLGCRGQELVRLRVSYSAEGKHSAVSATTCSSQLAVRCVDGSCKGLQPLVEVQVCGHALPA